MSFIHDSQKLRGLTYDAASCFGMPHVGAFYAGSSVKTNRRCEGACCAVCGKPATNSHHEPPLGMGGKNHEFALATPKGVKILRPALIALCGSGTTGCHGKRHNASLRFRWVWQKDEYAERWWSGYLLTNGFEPHDPMLYMLGSWEVTENGQLIKAIRS